VAAVRRNQEGSTVNAFIQVDIADFKAHVADLLAAYPELVEDEDLRADMIEGETDMVPLVTRLLKRKLDADTMVSAIKQRKADIAERQARYERQSEGFKALIKSMMLAADLDKLTLPDATISVTKARTIVEITDEASLPQGFVEIKRVPKKTEIKKALEAGEEIPGASLGLSEEGLMVRPK
jgi:hypothetical protein